MKFIYSFFLGSLLVSGHAFAQDASKKSSKAKVAAASTVAAVAGISSVSQMRKEVLYKAGASGYFRPHVEDLVKHMKKGDNLVIKYSTDEIWPFPSVIQSEKKFIQSDKAAKEFFEAIAWRDVREVTRVDDKLVFEFTSKGKAKAYATALVAIAAGAYAAKTYDEELAPKSSGRFDNSSRSIAQKPRVVSGSSKPSLSSKTISQ